MKGPSKALLSVEGIRSVYEFFMGFALNIPLKYISPKGDGHPVLVLPGLGTSDGSTYFLRNFLDEIGYKSQPWNLGRNLGPRQGMDNMLEQLIARVEEISAQHDGQQVSIIGWSLGGIYGREIAKLRPELVRQVITLGTPFKSAAKGTNAGFLYELLSKDKSHLDPDIIKKIAQVPPVPFTSMYSKTDGVVHWLCSIEEQGPYSENIEIPGASHLGLGHNPITLFVIANRLTKTRENWSHYNK